ncbi:hypothetical protein NDU88_007399 [Pleurodeles waltl]|uniref:Uncharacterized protein n=1 Tax=Pleurodeles waltl TaxID=8319 RepID=A0AAV7U152_PLEWA|nr:hypothetical protein NDU88_007399 [Pleurodeles waltl]
MLVVPNCKILRPPWYSRGRALCRKCPSAFNHRPILRITDNDMCLNVYRDSDSIFSYLSLTDVDAAKTLPGRRRSSGSGDSTGAIALGASSTPLLIALVTSSKHRKRSRDDISRNWLAACAANPADYNSQFKSWALSPTVR